MIKKQADVYKMQFYTPIRGEILDELMITGLTPDDFSLHGSNRFGNYVPLWDSPRSVESILNFFEDPHIVEVVLPYEMNGRMARIGPGVFGVRLLPPRYIADIRPAGGFGVEPVRSLASNLHDPVVCGGCSKEYPHVDLIPLAASTHVPTCEDCGRSVFSALPVPIRTELDYVDPGKKRKKRKKRRKRMFADATLEIQEFVLFEGRFPEEGESLEISIEETIECNVPDTYRPKDERVAEIKRLQEESDMQEAKQRVEDYQYYDRMASTATRESMHLQDLDRGDTFHFVGRGNRTPYRVTKKTEDKIYYRNLATDKDYVHSTDEAPRVKKVQAATCFDCKTVYNVDDIPVESTSQEPMCKCGGRVFSVGPSNLPLGEGMEPGEELPEDFFIKRKEDDRIRRTNPFVNNPKDTGVDVVRKATDALYEERNQWFDQYQGDPAPSGPVGAPEGKDGVIWREDSLELDPFKGTRPEHQVFPPFKQK